MSGRAPDRGPRLGILLVTQYFPPEVGAAPARAWHFARALLRAGHRIEVITGLPNHPSGVLQPGFRPGMVEDRDGVRVRRSWLVAGTRKTPLTRLANHLSFAASALWAGLAGGRYDVVMVSVPPLFVGLSAWLVSRRHRAPLVVDVRDDWPRAAIALGELRPGFAASVLDAQAGFLYSQAARVITVTPGMRRSLAPRGIPPERLALITNGADLETFAAIEPAAPADASRPFTVLYSGTHGLIHGMDVILDAAELLTREPGGDEMRFVFVGDGVAKPGLMESARARGLAACTFIASQPPETLARTLAGADLCVATTRAHDFSGETIPVKIFDYLAAGRPVVGAVSGDAASVLESSGGAIVTPPGDAAALARAIRALAGDPQRRVAMGRAGRAFVEAHYSRQALGDRLAALCEDVARGGRSQPAVNESGSPRD